MKRILILLLLAALLLAGCSGKPGDESTAEPVSTEPAETQTPMVSLYDLRKAMLAAEPELPEMMAVSSSDENADQLFTYLSEADYAKVEGYYLAYAADGSAYEIAVVCLRSAEDTAEMEASLKTHVDGRVSLYKNYAPDQMEQAKAAKIVTRGRYVALVMCKAQDAVIRAFEDGVK